MLLNELNRKKVKQILKKYKLDNKFKNKKILYNSMVFIIDIIKMRTINNLILSLLKCKQLLKIQKKL